MEYSVLVVEDDGFTRMALVSTLTVEGIHVVAACAGSADALSAQVKFNPHAALIDLDLGEGPTGLDVARVLRRFQPAIGIVFLSSYRDPRLVAGRGQKPPVGSQYLVKKDVLSAGAIRQAIEKSLEAQKGDGLWPNDAGDFGRLTSNQIEILHLVAQAYSNQEIASRRSITEKSVEQTIGRIAKRLGVDRRLDQNQRVSIARAYFRQTGS